MEPPHSENILVIEDGKAINAALCQEIETTLELATLSAQSMQEARGHIAARGESIFAAVADLNLPDAANGEVVDFLIDQDIPVIVLTGNMSDETREAMLRRNIVDYVVKQNQGEIAHVATLLKRLWLNRGIDVLVVDDSNSLRGYIEHLLRSQCLRVVSAGDGAEALALLDEHPGIRLVITDYNMPGMDGDELISRIRERFSRSELPIIGLSTHGSAPVSVRLLKSGANDFISRPFLNEEFLCRVSQNIELSEHLRTIRDAANKDYLTGLYNRRYFFEMGEKLFANARRNDIPASVAMLDIDFFKKVNDTYGHAAGDRAIKHVAAILSKQLREADLLARFGGEEFCVLGLKLDAGNVAEVFERVRANVENGAVSYEGHDIRFTISIGICANNSMPLKAMIDAADEALYKSKQSGRNRVSLTT